MPPGSTLVSDGRSWDEGKSNRTVIFINRNSVETNALHLREELLLMGWTRIDDQTVRPGMSSTLSFQRPGKELIVTVVHNRNHSFITFSETTYVGTTSAARP